MKFKIGDKVTLGGFIGTVVKIKPYLLYEIFVKWEYGMTYCYNGKELTLVDVPIINVDDLFEEIEL